MKSNLDEFVDTGEEHVYCPSPERIKRFCAVYQRRWSEKEHQKRSGKRTLIRWLIPEVSPPEYDETQMSD